MQGNFTIQGSSHSNLAKCKAFEHNYSIMHSKHND